MSGIVQNIERRSRPILILTCFGFLGLIGIIDYLAGFEIVFSVFYLLGVGFATWFVGRGFGLFMSVMSVGTWIVGDLAAGARFPSSFIPIWNATILLVFYFIVVWLLARLHDFHAELEDRVQQRTVALTKEMAERERLEKEILEVSESEQRRIGHDLHDSLCQHLTATAVAGQVLEEKLASKSLAEAVDANKIVELVEDGIALTRNLARGISPVEMEAEGLMMAFQELAANITRMSKLTCTFDCDSRVLIDDAVTATNLYRIAQEAVSNAIRHGKPKNILISLVHLGGDIVLTVEDDGTGLPETWQQNQGLGTRIMAHRATMIGASFSIEPNPTGGTFVKCSLAPSTEVHKPKQS